jgi:hypothetical protein
MADLLDIAYPVVAHVIEDAGQNLGSASASIGAGTPARMNSSGRPGSWPSGAGLDIFVQIDEEIELGPRAQDVGELPSRLIDADLGTTSESG